MYNNKAANGNDGGRMWECPICRKPAPKDELVACTDFQEILDDPKNANKEEVTIKMENGLMVQMDSADHADNRHEVDLTDGAMVLRNGNGEAKSVSVDLCSSDEDDMAHPAVGKNAHAVDSSEYGDMRDPSSRSRARHFSRGGIPGGVSSGDAYDSQPQVRGKCVLWDSTDYCLSHCVFTSSFGPFCPVFV